MTHVPDSTGASFWGTMLATVSEGTSIIAGLFTIAATILAFYVFIVNRDKVATALALLTQYSFHLSLGDLKSKLDRLNDLDASVSEDFAKIMNIFGEILGQLKGNSTLEEPFAKLIRALDGYCSERKRLTEPRKRTLVFEIREKLRQFDDSNIRKTIGDKR